MRLFPLFLALFWATTTSFFAQTLNDIDTTHGFGREVFHLYQRYDALRFSGYIQPQYQVAGAEGARRGPAGEQGGVPMHGGGGGEHVPEHRERREHGGVRAGGSPGVMA